MAVLEMVKMRHVSDKKKSQIIKQCFPKSLASLWLAPSRRARVLVGEGSRRLGRGAGLGTVSAVPGSVGTGHVRRQVRCGAARG